MNIRTTNPWRLAHAPDSQTTRGFFRRLLASILCCLTLSAGAATRSWTSPGGTNLWLWSDPANWDPHGVPQNGEDLWFSDPFSADLLMNNDLPNLTVRSLGFAIGDIGDASVHLYGYPVGVSYGIFNTYDFECQVYIHCGVRLAGNATFVTGNTETTSAVFSEETAMHFIGPIDLNGHSLVLKADATVLNEGRLFVEGGISGSGNVVGIAVASQISGGFDYPGILEFKGAGNDFSGTLTLNPEPGAEILLNVSSGVVVNDLLIITNVGTVKLLRPEQIGDAATVRIQDGAMLQLYDGPFVNGSDIYYVSYNETFQNLELITDSNDSRPSVLHALDATLSLQGNIMSICNNFSQTPAIYGKLNLLSGSHDINVSGSSGVGLDMQAQMLGFGNFSKSGNSALLLQVSNSFNSSITILQGVLDVRTNHALGDIAGSTTIAGGNLTLRNVAIGEELLFALGPGGSGEMPGAALTSIGVSSWSGQVALYTNLIVTGDMTFTGPISGTGGLGCFGGGTIRLGGTLANTYTGTTLVRCPLVEFNKPSDVKAFSGPIVVGGLSGGASEARWLNYYQSAGTLLTLYANGFVNLTNSTERFGAITFNGGQIDSGPFGICMLGNPFTTNASYLTVNAATTPAIINGFLSPAGGAAWITVANGVAEPDLLINAGLGGIAPQIIKQGPGTMRLAGAGNYIAETLVNEGILEVANNAALGSVNFGTIVNAGATLRLNTFSTVPESFALSGTGVGGTNSVIHVTGNLTVTGSIYLNGPSTINVAPGAGLAVDNKIGGTGPLTKTGSGNLFLGGVSGGTGNNNYSGSTIVTAGTLYLSKNQNVISVPGPLVVGPATVGSPATARFSRTGTMVAGGTATVNANSLMDLNNNNQTLTTLNLNDGGDVQTAAGTLSFTASGNINVGTLTGGLPGLQGSASISGRIAAAANNYLIFNVGPYGQLPLTSDPELVVSAQVAGNLSSIAKNGAGTMLLSGNNTFAGTPSIVTEVDINTGAVIAASPTALGGADNWVYVFNGASLAVVGNTTINNKPLYLNSTNPAALDNRGGSNVWNGPISLMRDSGISVNQDWSLTVPGTISGTGSLTKRGAGVLCLSGTANNTYSGNTYIDEGFLYLAKPPSLQAVPANLIIGRPSGGTFATVRHFAQDPIWGDVTVNNGGLLDLNGYDEYSGILTLNGGGDVQTGVGTLYPFTSVAVNPGSFADQSVISGRLGLFPGTIPFTVGAGTLGAGTPDCLISAVIVQSSTTAGLQKKGAGILRLTANNTYTGGTTVDGGTLWIDGSQPQSLIQILGARLQGSGTVGHISFGENAAERLAPGSSPGILTSSNFNANAIGGGTMEIELNGATAGTGYDQVNVRGAVNLTALKLKGSLGFNSAVGNEFSIINNDGSDAVTGTFTGLPQNAELNIGGELFQLSYTGGTGNDVVLTRLVTPPRPTLTIQRVSPASVRLIWPTNGPSFRLQSHTNLATSNWASVLPLPTIVGTNNWVTNTATDPQKFYRLVNP